MSIKSANMRLLVRQHIYPRGSMEGYACLFYKLPEDDWMGFTHAYFPTYAFDEYLFEKRWAFARRGDGYLALISSSGFELHKRAPDGYRELRAPGGDAIWVCQMGRAEQDGSFEEFTRKIQTRRLEFRSDRISLDSLRGERIDFGWEGSLLVCKPVSLILKNYHRPYASADLPCLQM
jgi:hypothetical protein